MSSTQNFFMRILPPAWAEEMRAESQRWILRCTCGHERSIWEAGGIRWKARGNPRRWMTCPQCGKKTWHSLRYKE